MWFNNLNMRGVLVDSLTSETEYIFLPDQSAALVGPNGVGKSSFVTALQRSFDGLANEKSDPFGLQLDFLIPADIETWCEDNGDFGVVRAIYNLVTGEGINLEKGEEFSPNNEEFHSGLGRLWEQSISQTYEKWHKKLSRMPESELIENESLDQVHRLIAIRDLFDSLIIKAQHNPADFEAIRDSGKFNVEKIPSLYQDYLSRIKGIAEKFNFAENRTFFVFTSVGTKDKPEWKVDCVYRISQEELKDSSELEEYARIFVLPKSLEDSKTHRGYFGFVTSDPNEKEIQQTYIRFIEDEVWFGLHLGNTTVKPGIRVINPDELTLDNLKDELMDLIDLPLTFSKNPSEVAFWNIAQIANQGWKYRNYKPQGGGFAPFDENLEFTDTFIDFLKTISETVSGYFQGFIPSAPSISISTNRKELWVKQGLLYFEAKDGYLSQPWSSLSDTQQRWLKVSLCLAIYMYFDLAIFIDEPERGLQRGVESTLLDHLELVQMETQIPWIFATHSAEVMSRNATTIQISKDREGMRTVRRVNGSLYPLISELGWTEEEYFQSKKLLVLTEGIMDKAMLDGFALEKFRINNIEVFSGHGLNSWKAFFDSHYLGKTAGVKLVFVADSVDIEKVSSLIAEARAKNEPQGVNHFFRTNIEKCVNEKWSYEQNHIVGSILAESFRNDFQKLRLDSTGDWDCLMWVSPQSLGFDSKANWRDLVAKFDQEPKGTSKASRGERFKQSLKRQLRQRGVSKPLDAARLEDLCAEIAISGQIPEKVGNLIDRIVDFANS